MLSGQASAVKILPAKTSPCHCPAEPVLHVVRPSLCWPNFACGKQSISLPSWTCLVCCQAKPLISKLPLYTKASSIAQLGLSCMLSGQASAVQILPAKTSPYIAQLNLSHMLSGRASAVHILPAENSPFHCPAGPVLYVVRLSL